MTGQTPIEAAILRRIRARNLLSCGPEGIDLELPARNVLIGPNGSGSPVLNVVGDDRRELQRDDVEPDRSILSQRKEPDQYPELAYLSRFYEGINLYGSWEFGRSAGIRDAQRSDVRSSPLTENLSNLGMFLNRLAPYPSAKSASDGSSDRALRRRHRLRTLLRSEHRTTPLHGGRLLHPGIAPVRRQPQVSLSAGGAAGPGTARPPR